MTSLGARGTGTLTRFTIAAGLAFAGLKLLLRLYDPVVVDDGFMFIRYADNLLRNGMIAWNPADGPSYGITALLFLVVVAPLRALLPNAIPLAGLLSSLLSGFLFFFLITAFVRRYASRRGVGNSANTVLLVITLVVPFEVVIKHLTSGMDTMFSLAFLTIYMFSAKWFLTGPTIKRAIGVGLLSGFLYAVRPDLLVYPFVLMGLVVWTPSSAATPQRSGAPWRASHRQQWSFR